jgi:hypothetical protein
MPTNRPAIPKNNVIEVIERHQQDAFRQLQQAGVPEVQALLVAQRISSFCLQILRQLDLLYREFEELVAVDGRSEPHQLWLLDKAGALLLQSEAGIAAIVAEAIRQATQDLKNQPPPPQQVIEPVMRPQQAPSGWPHFLLATLRHLVWVGGMAASLIFSYQASGSLLWAGIGLLIPFLLWYRLERFWLALIFPLIALGSEAWVLGSTLWKDNCDEFS